MQRYQSHKIVEAGKILRIWPDAEKGGHFLMEIEGGDIPEDVGKNWLLSRGESVGVTEEPDNLLVGAEALVGGYFVRYPDGYTSWSPAEAFEEGYGYAPDEPTAPTAHALASSAPRTLNSHKVNGTNDTLMIAVLDEPGQGGACHRYHVSGFNLETNPSAWTAERTLEIYFQNGPIQEVGVNGITHEVLLAILEDRLVGFQSGPYACEDNAAALHNIRLAQASLQRRTNERLRRGVEGKHVV